MEILGQKCDFRPYDQYARVLEQFELYHVHPLSPTPCDGMPWRRSRQTTKNLLGQQHEATVAERGGEQVVEADLLAQLQDLVEHRIDRAVKNYAIEIALDRVGSRRGRVLDADRIVGCAEIRI